MIKMEKQAAVTNALKLAEILCSTPDNGIQIDKLGAKDLADFIEELTARFTGERSSED